MVNRCGRCCRFVLAGLLSQPYGYELKLLWAEASYYLLIDGSHWGSRGLRSRGLLPSFILLLG